MELRHLKYFVAIAEEESLNRAAARLHVAQPALSRQLRDLEDELGGPLFTRSPAGVALTRSGKLLLRKARAILSSVDETVDAVRKISAKPAQKFTLGYIATMHLEFLKTPIEKLQAANPGLELILFQGMQTEQLSAVRQKELDVAYVNLPARLDQLESEVVLRAPLVVVLPPKHPLLRKKSLRWSDLKNVDFVFCTRRSRPEFYDFIHAQFLTAGIKPRTVREIGGHLDGIVGLVKLGQGISVLPYYPGAERVYQVEWRPLQKAPLLEFALAWRQDDTSALIEEFRRFARKATWPGVKDS